MWRSGRPEMAGRLTVLGVSASLTVGTEVSGPGPVTSQGNIIRQYILYYIYNKSISQYNKTI